MTQVTLGSEKTTTTTTKSPLEAYPFDAHFGKRSVILDPRLRGVHKARIDCILTSIPTSFRMCVLYGTLTF